VNQQLTNADLVELTAWRRELHRHPDLSGDEEQTARRVRTMLVATGPDRIWTGLGGHGIAALYDSGKPGPRVLLRCELDGLPIEDLGQVTHRSTVAGKGHLCGHDGHMAMLAAMARMMGRRRPARGSVVLMFQPAEENGAGAAAVINDPAFAEIAPDYAFAIHNFPGLPLGQVALVDGPTTCASRGMKLILTGRTAHASQPQTGLSPMRALVRLMPELTALGRSDLASSDPDFALVTITHARMGAAAFGIAPGEAQLFATLRTLTDTGMAGLVAAAETLAQEVARDEGLRLDITYEDVFVTCVNDSQATGIARAALDQLGIVHGPGTLPLRASEDFGGFGRDAKLALLMLGSGEDHPALHNPDYDFPDDLIPIGARIYSGIIDRILGISG
jgi:amidohydrolase